MARRPDSPYSDDTNCPYPENMGKYGEVNWKAQNEGQFVTSLGLHFQDPDEGGYTE